MAHHEPFKALGPIEWSSVDSSGLASLLPATFASAQTLIDSIPLPSAVTQAQRVAAGGGGGRRARSHTESALGAPISLNRALAGSPSAHGSPGGAPAPSAEFSAALHKEWKECKINPRDNPLAINVHRLPAKDGRGAWFARRSIHEGIGFAKFRLGLEREFAETLKVQGGPGAGKVRGIGAEKRLEHEIAKGVGQAEVYQLSAHFGGPTTPRDFVTLLLSSASDNEGDRRARRKTPPRQFMIISRPCIHKQCPPRTGFIRGQYESVEVIREVPIDKPLRRTRSSIDLSREEVKPLAEDDDDITREAILRSARKVAESLEQNGGKRKPTPMSVSVSFDARSEAGADDDNDDDDDETAIEWLMITRSDPGGSVPRFMVEKGTPGGIVSDAGLLLKWLATKDPSDFEERDDTTIKQEAIAEGEAHAEAGQRNDAKPIHATKNLLPDEEAQAQDVAPSGFYGMIAGALGAGVSVVASRMPNPFSGSTRDTESEPDPEAGETAGSESDASSVHSFASAMESAPGQQDATSTELLTPEVSSTHSTRSDESKAVSATPTQHEKELRKLEERRRKVQEKMSKMRERSLAKKSEDKEKDEAAQRKLKEKHEREVARQDEKYRRELQRLEERRLQDERKAEERRRKQVEREEKANLALELERVRSERDVARKQLEILKEQIGELQAQNTMLVAKLGKNGLLKEEDFRKPREKSRVSLKE